MARNFKKIAKGIRMEPQSGPPSSPIDGELYFDSGLGKFQKRESGTWSDLGATSPTIDGDNVTTEYISGILSVKALGIDTAQLANLGVTTGKIANLAVTTGKIANQAVTQTQLGNGAVGTSQIATDAVTGNVIADLGVFDSKRAALTSALSASSGVGSITATSATDVPNLSISLSSGTISPGLRPLRFELVSDNSGNNGNLEANFNGLVLVFQRNGVELSRQVFASNGALLINIPVSCWGHTDLAPLIGSQTYKIQGFTPTGGTVGVRWAKLLGYRL